MLTAYFESYATAHKPYKGGSWCYEDGCIYRGLELIHRATGDDRWLAHIKRMVDAQILDGPKLAGYNVSDYNIDNILSGRALLYLHEVTGEDRYIETAGLLIDQLATHPRTKSGVYWHKLRYPWQVWLDGLYMGVPFQMAYGLRTGNEDLITDGITQVATALEMNFVPSTGLYAHAMDEARKQPWCDPETGQSRAHWSRALGWVAMALADIADLVGPERFAPLKDRAEKLFADLAALRRDNGLWLQVIDRPDLDGNYSETSASAMFVYALMTARRVGLFPDDGTDFFGPLAAFAVRPKAGGGHEMVQMCEVAGLGVFENRFRDGSAEYYLSEKVVADDAKGVGPMMMCYAASLAAARTPEAATV